MSLRGGGEKEEEEEEEGNADEEDEDDDDGQVEDSNEAMNEWGDGYLPAPPMEVEGVKRNTDEGQIILIGKDIEEEVEETHDKGNDEEAQRHHTSEESEDEVSNDESVEEEGVVLAASNSPDNQRE